MKIHLVSGFLGSGKTTAIISASRALMEQGLKVGVITNDQGKFLVDTHFMRLNDIPAVEVNGGCFCCNYKDFNQSLEQIVQQVKPDVVFAESVGSCADIVATVVKPLLQFKTSHEQDTSLTTFSDARLLKKFLAGEELPFQENVIYIFEQQIQEAGILIINKIDLLPSAEVDALLQMAKVRYPEKKILPLVSLNKESVLPWLAELAGIHTVSRDSLDISYAVYGSGEQNLAWFDAQLRIQSGVISAISWIERFLMSVVTRIQVENIPVGHLKFLIEDGQRHQKFSLVSLDDGSELRIENLPEWGKTIVLTINARLECEKDTIQGIFHEILNEPLFSENNQAIILVEEAFHPGFPNPTYRFPKI